MSKTTWGLFIAFIILSACSKKGQDSSQKKIALEKQNSNFAKDQPYVVLVSIDGFRHDYIAKYKARNLQQLKDAGASVSKMIPSFPSKTFPNHYTIVTGMYPANHGLVSNGFYSRSKKQSYSIRNKEVVQDGSWYGGIPLWALAEQQGMLSASYFWVGSEAEIANERPSYFEEYDGSVSNELRVQGVLDWLNFDEEERPHMITLYFSLVDDYGHRYGPDSKKMQEAINEIDTLIGELQRGISKTELPVYLAVTSDHGMSNISTGIVLSDFVDLANNEVYYSTPTMIYTESQQEKDRIFNVLDTVSQFDTYKKEDLPIEWNYNNEDRVGDLVLVNHAPLVILSKPSVVSGGTHGFDPFTNDEMATIFLISGPRIKQGIELSPFQNIHIYPFLTSLLGLTYDHEIDGDPSVLAPMLK
jgi:predicted AlkP superfamily pyrophosphatase or phosphodiesterase